MADASTALQEAQARIRELEALLQNSQIASVPPGIHSSNEHFVSPVKQHYPDEAKLAPSLTVDVAAIRNEVLYTRWPSYCPLR